MTTSLRDVGPGVVGEIVYRGPMVMQGYFGLSDATEEAFAGGWFHSGDLATRDEEGYLRLVDRKKDMIVTGGENVYPAEVERVFREHPAVADVAVIGVPHPRWVETPVAFVVPATGQPPGERELVAHCRGRLAGYKKPSAFHFVGRVAEERGGQGRQARAAHAVRRLASKLNSCHNSGCRAWARRRCGASGGGGPLSSYLRMRPGPAPLVLDSRLLVPTRKLRRSCPTVPPSSPGRAVSARVAGETMAVTRGARRRVLEQVHKLN